MPFDITCIDENNKGKRNTEQYRILGTVGHNITDRCAIGGKFDLNSLNMARTKDLRHVNSILDLKANAGLSYLFFKGLKMCINYSYDRYIEGLNFNIYGSTDTQYLSLIIWGIFT